MTFTPLSARQLTAAATAPGVITYLHARACLCAEILGPERPKIDLSQLPCQALCLEAEGCQGREDRPAQGAASCHTGAKPYHRYKGSSFAVSFVRLPHAVLPGTGMQPPA